VLTRREEEVLDAATRGMTNAQIAEELFLSVHTIAFHLGNVYEKRGLKGGSKRAAAVRWAVEQREGAEVWAAHA